MRSIRDGGNGRRVLIGLGSGKGFTECARSSLLRSFFFMRGAFVFFRTSKGALT